VPIIEIALFIILGNIIGLLPTLLGVLVTALIGSVVIKAQGTSLIEQIRQTTARGALPAKQLAEGMMIGIAGALLLTPGYFTDFVGFLLLVPLIRTFIYNEIKKRISIVSASSSFQSSFHEQNETIIKEDEIIDIDPKDWHETKDTTKNE